MSYVLVKRGDQKAGDDVALVAMAGYETKYYVV